MGNIYPLCNENLTFTDPRIGALRSALASALQLGTGEGVLGPGSLPKRQRDGRSEIKVKWSG